mgnify:CR=1 FL=1
MSPSNFDKEYGISFDLTFPIKYKRWSSTNNISFTQNTINDNWASSSNNSPYIYIYSNNQFKINNTNSISINGWGLTNRKEGIFNRDAVFTLNTSYKKKFSDQFEIALSFNDIFNSLEFKEDYGIENIIAKNIFYTDVNEFSISFNYSFGKIKKTTYKNRDIDTNINRVR